jgi:hypothetical protein
MTNLLAKVLGEVTYSNTTLHLTLRMRPFSRGNSELRRRAAGLAHESAEPLLLSARSPKSWPDTVLASRNSLRRLRHLRRGAPFEPAVGIAPDLLGDYVVKRSGRPEQEASESIGLSRVKNLAPLRNLLRLNLS